jgi:glyoxylase-like metal-dependent hydrolase (beta-lactamase superfamily II)
MAEITSLASTDPVAQGVARVGILFVNAYLVGEPGDAWVLVDTGLPLSAGWTATAARERFGERRPEAIVLTHGHFDHAGSALELANEWGVPVYAHPDELPFLTGRADYPPQDPTMGGAIAQMARAFPRGGQDLGRHVRELPADGSLPQMPGWRWLHTPGHTPGHVSLFRERDRMLLAGDAVTTMDLDSWSAQVTRSREFDRPPAPFTPDWPAARRSVEMLADLQPAIVAAGHGLPIRSDTAERLRKLAARFPVPSQGRYVGHPAHYDDGSERLPPPPPDPVGARLKGGAAALAAVALLAQLRKRR